VIDVLAEGFHLTSLADGVSFDFNGDGQPLFMSWTDPNYHNAWLALDRNSNGTIDSVQELFGYATQPQMPSPDGVRSGWLALAMYDQPAYGGDGDGAIDANDAIYSQLLLWIDENHDGISQSQELHHLDEMSVARIDLTYNETKSYKDQFGNTFHFESFVTVTSQGSNAKPKLKKQQAWDVVLNASDTRPASGPQQDQFCSLIPRHLPNWDLRLEAEVRTPLRTFDLCGFIGE